MAFEMAGKETTSFFIIKRSNVARITIIIILAILIMSAVSSTDILDWRTNQTSNFALKFFPLILSFLATLPIVILFPFKNTSSFALRSLIINPFLTLFLILALPGVFYSKFILELPNSYFTQIVMILVFFPITFIFLALPEKNWQKSKDLIIYAFAFIGLIAALAVIKNFLNDYNDTHSDVAVLLVQTWAIAFLYLKGMVRRVILVSLFFIVALTFKNTAMLLLLMTVLGAFFLSNQIFLKKKIKLMSILLILFGGVFFLTVGVGFYFLMKEYFSDGNTVFRLWIWQQKYREFLMSPIMGDFFMAPSAIFFEPFWVQGSIDNLVPTHNDWLDVLVQGGIIGFVLFFAAYFRPIILSITLKKNMVVPQKDTKLATWIILFLIGVALAFTFNPFLMNPDISFILWFVAAFGLVEVFRTKRSFTNENEQTA